MHTSIPISPPSCISLPPSLSHPSRWSQSTWADLPVLCSCFPLAIYFTFGSVYMSVLLSHFVPTCPAFNRCFVVSATVILLYYQFSLLSTLTLLFPGGKKVIKYIITFLLFTIHSLPLNCYLYQQIVHWKGRLLCGKNVEQNDVKNSVIATLSWKNG